MAGADIARSPRWARRPDGSTWGDFGPDDELGRLNLITPEKVRQAAREIQDGLSFCLSLPLDLPGGRGDRHGPQLFPTGEGCCNMNRPLASRFPGSTGVICDDAVELCLQASTQWDGFSHYGVAFDADGDGQAEVVYYNGWRAGEHIRGVEQGPRTGAFRLGIETFAVKAIQSRGVMLDFERAFGPERRRVRFEDLQALIRSQNVEIARGDILCLHTGMGRALVELNGREDLPLLRTLGAELDGSDPRLLDWIAESQVSAIVADNFAVEALQKVAPASPAPILPLHEHCLFRLGVPLGELWWLTPLAAALAERGRHHFMLTAPPLRLPRAVASPATPVATI
jgi:hypothetical protein